ncbi:MAG: hypothetical protein ABI687_09075 [Flavitalea sp.]
MKKQFMRMMQASLSSKFFKATAIVLLMSGSTYLNAQAIATSNPVSKEPRNAVVSYLLNDNDMVVFQVDVENAVKEKFNVIVRDGSGSTIFNEAYTQQHFSKKFKLPKDNQGKLTFIVKSPSETSTQSFEINSNIRYVEEVVVKKII